MNPIETTELDKIARDWCEIFYDVIPEDQLRRCYIAAEQNPDRKVENQSFPIRRREILDAWYRLDVESDQPKGIRECDFCRWFLQDPAQQPCPIHSEGHVKLKDFISS